MTSKKRFKLKPGAVEAFNRRAESVQWAAAEILGIPVPLAVFDPKLQVPPGHQRVDGLIENTLFGVAMTSQQIKIHPRELERLADETARRLPNISDQELSARVDSQVWRLLIMTSVEGPVQGREDKENIVSEIFSAALNDWAAREYGVSLPNKTRDRG